MDRLITYTEFAAYRNISQKLDTGKINEAIDLAQQSDLINILGEFYFDVIKNKDESTYADLLNGCEFEYEGEDFEHVGIKKMLADYAYARYIYIKPVNDTSFGFQFKETQDGTNVDRNYLKDMQKQAQIDAGIKFKYIEKYILSEPDLFSRYCESNKPKTSFSQIKISKL